MLSWICYSGYMCKFCSSIVYNISQYLLLLDYWKKKLCLYGGIVVLIVLILISVISRISYRFMFVWMPYSFSVMIISILAFAIWLIARGREEK